MDGTQGELTVSVIPGKDVDADELDRMTRQLREELLELDVDQVTMASTGVPAPGGARGAELVSVGTLVVVLGLQRQLVRAVADVAVAWLERQQSTIVIVDLPGGTRIELRGQSSKDQDRLLTAIAEGDAGAG